MHISTPNLSSSCSLGEWNVFSSCVEMAYCPVYSDPFMHTAPYGPTLPAIWRQSSSSWTEEGDDDDDDDVDDDDDDDVVDDDDDVVVDDDVEGAVLEEDITSDL